MSTTRTFALGRGARGGCGRARGASRSCSRPSSASGHGQLGKAAFTLRRPAMVDARDRRLDAIRRSRIRRSRSASRSRRPAADVRHVHVQDREGRRASCRRGLRRGRDGREARPARRPGSSDLAQPTGSTAPGALPVRGLREGAEGQDGLQEVEDRRLHRPRRARGPATSAATRARSRATRRCRATVKVVLTQKVTYTKGVPKSTIGGTATFTNLPPISPDGVQTGDCKMTEQSFGVSGTVRTRA